MNVNEIDSCIQLVLGLQKCLKDVKAMNLRALMANSKQHSSILNETWTRIISWLDNGETGLTPEEGLRLRTIVMKARGERGWYDPDDSGG